MFSQYTWWDFTKIVLALALPYYAYVVWTYYREDIREWINHRGRNSEGKGTAPVASDEEQETDLSLFAVKKQTKHERHSTAVQSEDFDHLSKSGKVASQPNNSNTEGEKQTFADSQLRGPDVSEEQATVVGFPLFTQSQNTEEYSVNELRRTAERLTNDGTDLVKPMDESDKSAIRLADIINQQRASPLDDIAFNR